MNLDLRLLKQLHPLLPITTAAEYMFRAAVALQRSHHEPGVFTAIRSDVTNGSDGVIDWDRWNEVGSDQLDHTRTTEDGAEAVSLVFANVAHGWAVLRRLQRGEYADWLLTTADGSRVALEVSGVAGDPDANRLREKIYQVSRATCAEIRAACVVTFGPPSIELACDD